MNRLRTPRKASRRRQPQQSTTVHSAPTETSTHGRWSGQPTRTGWTRRAAGAAGAIVFSAGLLVVPAESAQAASHYGTAMVTTQRMSDASLKSTQHGTYSKGRKLSLSCYKRGQSVKGYYSKYIPGGYDNLWYKVSDGRYVADVDLNTGSNNPVTKKCSGSKATSSPTKKTSSSSVDTFVSQYKGESVDFDNYAGAQCTDLYRQYNVSVIGREMGRVPGDGGAHSLWDNFTPAMARYYVKVSRSSTPHKGDVAVWSRNLPYSGGAGHVAIVLTPTGSTLTVAQQNYRGQRFVTVDKKQSKNHLLGYLRPKKFA